MALPNARHRRFVNPGWADAIITHEFSVIFLWLAPNFPSFLSSLQNHAPGSLCEPSNLPHLFQRTTKIVLVNDALFGNDTGVSGPRPVVFPNQTISISKGAGFRPRDVTRPEQRLNLLERQEKSILPTALLVRTYSTMIPRQGPVPWVHGNKMLWNFRHRIRLC